MAVHLTLQPDPPPVGELRLKVSWGLFKKEKSLYLGWNGKLYDLCDIFILGLFLSFSACSVSYSHPKWDLQFGPVKTPLPLQVDRNSTAFTMNPLSLDRLWTLLSVPCDRYVRTLTLSATVATTSTRLSSANPWFPRLACFYLKSVLRVIDCWLYASMPLLNGRLQKCLAFSTSIMGDVLCLIRRWIP